MTNTKILFFSGVPIDDAATLYRSGTVAKLLLKTHKIVFASVSAHFSGIESGEVNGLPVVFVGQAHYYARETFSKRERLSLTRALTENIKTVYRLTKLLRQEKPDRVLVITTMPVALMFGIVSRLLGFWTAVDIEDLVTGQMRAAGYSQVLVSVYKLIEDLVLPIINRKVVCSHYLQERYPKSVIIPNMVDLKIWENGKKKGIKKRGRKIAFVGQMGAYHGQAEVLESLADILKSKKLELIFIGGGEKEADLKNRVRELGLEDKVSFRGQRTQIEVARILAECDFGILPMWDKPVHQSRHPLKLIEYLAAGLVVVTNRVGEIEYIIKDGKNGLLCPAGRIECLGERIAAVMDKLVLMANISKKAQETASQFSKEKIMPQWIRFLNL
jgi:glycosyltransferase involved in cell wall biosynthesis